MDFVFFDDVSSLYPALALPRLEHLHGRQPLTSSTGRSLSQAIGEVVAPVALLSGIALSPESPVRYGRHRRKVVISLRSPSLALLGLGLPLLLLFSSQLDRLAPYCFYTLGLCSLLISGLG